MSAASNDQKKSRSARTTSDQYEIYVVTIENDEIFRTGKSKTGYGPQHNDRVWTKMTSQLNSSGFGPTRDKDGWKKVVYKNGTWYFVLKTNFFSPDLY